MMLVLAVHGLQFEYQGSRIKPKKKKNTKDYFAREKRETLLCPSPPCPWASWGSSQFAYHLGHLQTQPRFYNVYYIFCVYFLNPAVMGYIINVAQGWGQGPQSPAPAQKKKKKLKLFVCGLKKKSFHLQFSRLVNNQMQTNNTSTS